MAKQPVEGALRIWHIPQVGADIQPFHVPVADVQSAKLLLNTLWDYDNFQLENKIKPDFASVSGLQVFEEGEWLEWIDEDGDYIAEVMRNESQGAALTDA